jgi:signal transduction histidine kinase
MFDKDVIRIRNASLMDLAVYLTLFIFVGTGFLALPDMTERIIVLILLLVFGLAYRFGYHTATTSRQVNVYMAIQALIVAFLIIRFPAADLFSFLLFMLVIQAAIALPSNIAARWVVVLFFIEGIRLFTNSNGEQFINLVLLSPAYFLMGVFGYSLRQAEIAHREKELLLEELQKAQEQLQELAVTEERARLARELHDSLGHRLTVAVVQLEGAQRLIPTKPEQASDMIGTMRDELKNALAELRTTVTAMRSPIAENQPLESVLATLIQSFQQTTGLATHFTKGSNLTELPGPSRLALYRATQEGLTNIQRHADAQNAWINLEANHNQITLTIEDDGKGLDQLTEKGSGVGLVGLGERASQLSGEMRIIQREAGGTKLTFIIPVPEERKTK